MAKNTTLCEAYVGWKGESEDLVHRLLNVPSLLKEGCLTLYGEPVFGGWDGKYPSRGICTRVTCSVNPLRVSDEDALREFCRLLREVAGDNAFIPVYTRKVTVTNALEVN